MKLRRETSRSSGDTIAAGIASLSSTCVRREASADFQASVCDCVTCSFDTVSSDSR